MLEAICAFIHNYFEYDRINNKRLIYPGEYTITGGNITLPFLRNGQYFRIVGSALNDGVYQYPVTEPLNDEEFTGEIWEMRVPKAFLSLAAEIGEWETKYGAIAKGPYQSESFGGYSYSKATSSGSGTGGGELTGWQAAFRSQLNQYRKLA